MCVCVCVCEAERSGQAERSFGFRRRRGRWPCSHPPVSLARPPRAGSTGRCTGGLHVHQGNQRGEMRPRQGTGAPSSATSAAPPHRCGCAAAIARLASGCAWRPWRKSVRAAIGSHAAPHQIGVGARHQVPCGRDRVAGRQGATREAKRTGGGAGGTPGWVVVVVVVVVCACVRVCGGGGGGGEGMCAPM